VHGRRSARPRSWRRPTRRRCRRSRARAPRAADDPARPTRTRRARPRLAAPDHQNGTAPHADLELVGGQRASARDGLSRHRAVAPWQLRNPSFGAPPGASDVLPREAPLRPLLYAAGRHHTGSSWREPFFVRDSGMRDEAGPSATKEPTRRETIDVAHSLAQALSHSRPGCGASASQRKAGGFQSCAQSHEMGRHYRLTARFCARSRC
jgi:hypothetical protein